MHNRKKQQKKEPCIIWWRTRPLGFHQEQMETMENLTEISGEIRIQKEEYPRIGFVSNLILFT